MTVTDRAATEWPREPRLRFAADAWRRLAGYVTNCGPEISGMGFVEEDSTGDLIVTRVLILQQEADELETTLDGAAVSALLAECVERGLDVAGLRLW